MTDKSITDFKSIDLVVYFEYLDELRDSGVTNMFGAAPYLTREFPQLNIYEARTILGAWSKTFDGESPAEKRVAAAASA